MSKYRGIFTHEVISRAVERTCHSFRQAFDGISEEIPVPNIVIMFGLPRLQAFYHILPAGSGSGGENAEGPSSPFFRAIAHEAGPPYLTDDELKAIVRHAMYFPQVREGLRTLIEARVPTRLHFDVWNGSLDNFLYLLLHGFSSDPLTCANSIWDLDERNWIIHVLLNAIPQFNHVRWSEMGEPWKTGKDKLDSLHGCWNEFSRTPLTYSFTERSFVLLSAIESLQWGPASSFGVIRDLTPFVASKHNDQDLSWLVLSHLRLYFYGNYGHEAGPPFDFSQLYRDRVIGANLRSVVRLLAEVLIESEVHRCVVSERPHHPVYWFSRSLTSMLGFQRLKATLTSPAASHEVFECNRIPIENFHKDIVGSQTLLTGEWGTYEVHDRADFEARSILSNRVRDFRPSAFDSVPKDNCLVIRFDWPDSTSLAVLVWFSHTEDDQVEYNSLLAFAHSFSALLRRLSGLAMSVASGRWQREWFKTAFHERYMSFDEARQNSNDDFADRKTAESVFLIQRLADVVSDDAALVIDLGVGYGRVAEKLLAGNPNVICIGYDASEVLLSSADERLSEAYGNRFMPVPGEFLDMRAKLAAYVAKADLVIMMFSTFGCYPTDEENARVFEAAYDLVRPGGELIIEQYNPTETRKHRWCTVNGIGQFDGWELHKSCNYVKVSDTCWNYCGHYYYYDRDKKLQAPDFYDLRLYTLEWFTNQALTSPRMRDAKLTPFGKFADKKDQSSYDPHSDLLILVIEKPLSDSLMAQIKTWLHGACDMSQQSAIKQEDKLSFRTLSADARLLNLIARKRLHEKYADITSHKDNIIREVRSLCQQTVNPSPLQAM